MLSVRMLGVFTILVNEQRLVDDLGPSGRLLAGYLIEFAGRAHRRDRLADQFWGHLDPERARAALNTALWRLRKVLAAEPESGSGANLRTFGTEVVLDTAPWLEVDTHRFASSVKQALTAAPADSAYSVRLLEAAAECYTGPFLDGDDADWILEERERLHSLFIRGASELLRFYGRDQRYEEGIAIGRRLLALDPFRESIHRSLLILLVLNGQQAEALRHHERWAEAFRRELDIEPMPQTLRLAALVRSGKLFEQFDQIKNQYFTAPADKAADIDRFFGGETVAARRDVPPPLPRKAPRFVPPRSAPAAEKAWPADASRR